MATEGVASLVAGDFHRAFVGLISNSVGLASAYREHSQQQHSIADTSPDSRISTNESENNAEDETVENPVTIQNLTLPTTTAQKPKPLSQLVILPQRRPGVKRKGFLRAYAPVLQNAGISQPQFLQFLNDFDAAAKANPVFTVVALAGEVVGMVPEAICMAVGACVKTAADIAGELDSRRKTNGFLDKMNEELFMPRGVYAMIMKYRPAGESSRRRLLGKAAGESLGVEVKVEDVRDDGMVKEMPGPGAKPKNVFSLEVGRTEGALRLPEAAPLVFVEARAASTSYEDQGEQSGTEEAVDGDKSSQKKPNFADKIKGKTAWASDYLDKRAHMNLAARDADASALSVPEEKRTIKNRWADPNNKMYHHPMMKLALGGIPTDLSLGSKTKSSRANDSEPSEASSRSWTGAMSVSTDFPGQAFIKSALMENLLYLAIVNLPSKDEMERAREKVDVAVELEA